MKKIKKHLMKRVGLCVLCFAMAVSLCGCSMLDYKKAVMLYEGGGYEGAKEIFDAIPDYKDSVEYSAKAQLVLDYRNAIEFYAAENYAEAAALFEILGDYEDSEGYLEKCQAFTLAEIIVGRWETEEVDMTDMFTGMFMEQMAALGYSELGLEEFEKVTLVQRYSFEEYGVMRVGFTEESFDSFMASLIDIMRTSMLNLTEQELIAVAEEYAVTYEELLAAMEVSSAEEYLEYSLGMSLDELFEVIFGGDTMSTTLTEMSGVWYIRDGKLCTIAGEEQEEAEYDPETDTITMLSNSIDEYAYLYPYTMTRVDSAKPTA